MSDDPDSSAHSLPPWMTLAEVAAWLAFGEVLPLEKWPWASAYSASRDWGLPIADGFLGRAIAARASGHVWRPIQPPLNAWRYRARARALLRHNNDPAELAVQLRADEARIREADDRLSRALVRIRDAMARGRLQAWGYRRRTSGSIEIGDLTKIKKSVLADAAVQLYPATAGRDDPYSGGFLTAELKSGTDVWVKVCFQGDAVAKADWRKDWLANDGKLGAKVAPHEGAALSVPDPMNISVSDFGAIYTAELPPPPKVRRRAPFTYEKDDAPLVEEMHRLIAAGAARSPWDAALVVVGKAKGNSLIKSRAQRLLGRYTKRFSTELL